MRQTPERTLVYCKITQVPLYRHDIEGRGIHIWCKGHRRQELVEWSEMQIPKTALVELLANADAITTK